MLQFRFLVTNPSLGQKYMAILSIVVKCLISKRLHFIYWKTMLFFLAIQAELSCNSCWIASFFGANGMSIQPECDAYSGWILCTFGFVAHFHALFMLIKSVVRTTVRSSLRFYFVLKNEKTAPYLDRQKSAKRNAWKIGSLIPDDSWRRTPPYEAHPHIGDIL